MTADRSKCYFKACSFKKGSTLISSEQLNTSIASLCSNDICLYVSIVPEVISFPVHVYEFSSTDANDPDQDQMFFSYWSHN